MNYSKKRIAKCLDLAMLQPMAKQSDIKATCAIANKCSIKSVCVAPVYVPLACSLFNNVSTVIGYPHGNTTPTAKYYEALEAMRNGAKEIDVVINYGRFLDGDSKIVETELTYLVTLAHRMGILVKAILETTYYTKNDLIRACDLCKAVEVDFIKTSTGITKGADVFSVEVLKKQLKGSGIFIKASGGIKTYADVATFLDLGCKRIGSSNFSNLLP